MQYRYCDLFDFIICYIIEHKQVEFILTNLSRLEFPSLINWTSPFPFKGLLGGIFYFYLNFNRTFCKQTVEL